MSVFNSSQQRSIAITFQDVHRRMEEIEGFLARADVQTPFSHYVKDLSPTEARVVRDYFEQLRAAMLAHLREADIPLEVRRTSLRWTVQVHLIGLSVTVAEMSPESMAGFGTLSDKGRELVVKFQQDLYRRLDRVSAYVNQGQGRDLSQRLAQLEASGNGVGSLVVLDRIITTRGLVEFRPMLDDLVGRLESPQFEIAVFGRVSSGKSSLLNHLVGRDVLPVGVTPVTAVPTRIVRGDSPSVVVTFAQWEPKQVPVEGLADYASEAGNPGNRKHVTGIIVQMPSPRLRDGVVLVDTPGVGSLAHSGSAETFAYLPRCDLGVVLIDCSSTLTPDDIDLLRLLTEAGVPAQVLLSKADLLAPADRQRSVEYVRDQVRQQLGLELPVYPVSTVGQDEDLLTAWFDVAIAPLLAGHRSLAQSSVRRKVAHLRESVEAALQVLRDRQRRDRGTAADGAEINSARTLLDEADAAILKANLRCRDWMREVPALVALILNDSAQAIFNGTRLDSRGSVRAAVLRLLTDRGQEAVNLLNRLRQFLTETLRGVGHRLQGPAPAEDGAEVGGFPWRNLPVPEVTLPPGWERVVRPWWGEWVPRLGVWVIRRRLAQDEDALRALVETYDRHLQAWLKANLGQLVGAYEARAEVVRQNLSRFADNGAGVDGQADLNGLDEDLRELASARSVERTS